MIDEKTRIDAALVKEMAGRRELYAVLAEKRRGMQSPQFFKWARRELGWSEYKTRSWMRRMGWR